MKHIHILIEQITQVLHKSGTNKLHQISMVGPSFNIKRCKKKLLRMGSLSLLGMSSDLVQCMLRLTLPAPCISERFIMIKIKLNFYFHTTLRCLKRFYKGLKGLKMDLRQLHRTSELFSLCLSRLKVPRL